MKGYRFLSRMSSFTGRAAVYFYALSVLLFFFYLLGGYQDFLDSTQVFLLSLLRVTLGLELIACVWLAGFLIYRGVQEHRAFVIRWILVALSLVSSAAFLVALRYVQQWLQS
jgi:hypothetical protein